MKLEDQVTSLETSKKLKELGVKQESIWNWIWANEKYRLQLARVGFDVVDGIQDDRFAAFTVAELGEMLPKRLEYQFSKIGTRSVYFETGKIQSGNGWYIQYTDRPNDYVHCAVQGKTEAEARAKMRVYLLENNLIKL